MTQVLWILLIAIVVGLGVSHFKQVTEGINMGLTSVNEGLKQVYD